MVNYLSLYKLRMMISVFFTLIFFAWVQAQCPEENNIAPCKCVTANGEVNVLCRGEIGLPRLTEILMKTFCGETIKKFELIQSDIDYLPSNLFYKVIVKDIQVSFTNISHFTRAGISAFFGQERYLESLSMRRCHLVNGLQWQMIGDLQVLTYLDLSFNDLSRIPEQWFKHPPPNLRSLTLKGNKIRALESGAFYYMHKLLQLDVSENQITSIVRKAFPWPGNNLLYLTLSYNNLETLPEDLFDEMLGLRRIYLDSNKLKTLPENVWSPVWGELEHLDLYGNNLTCGCDTYWVSELRPPPLLYGECYTSTRNVTRVKLSSLNATHFEECLLWQTETLEAVLIF